MNKATAEAWVDELTSLLSNRELVLVHATPLGLHVVRNRPFENARVLDYGNGECGVTINDGYGVVTVKRISLNPDDRTVIGERENGDGELCRFAWNIEDEPGLWAEMNAAQRRVWRI